MKKNKIKESRDSVESISITGEIDKVKNSMIAAESTIDNMCAKAGQILYNKYLDKKVPNYELNFTV